MKKIDKEKKERVMEHVAKVNSEERITNWNGKEGLEYPKKVLVKRGKKIKASGARFELNVRKDLESKGRIVDKWNNNVGMENKEGQSIIKIKRNKKFIFVIKETKEEISFENIIFNKVIISKKKFNPYNKAMMLSGGFPDFISIQHRGGKLYDVIGVESKMNGILSKIEKHKCLWYLQNNIFSQILIAQKGDKRGEIEYNDFFEKYGKKYNKI